MGYIETLLELHKSQDITLPDGSWGKNCVICDGLYYPCATVLVIQKEMA
jgi:hypothetical protein